jgi:cytochrome c
VKYASKFIMAAALVPMLTMGTAFAGERGTQPEAIAMVKKAVTYIKANGADKAYAEFSNKTGSFEDRDLYVVVYDMTGKCLAHGSNAKLVGKGLIEVQDADGVYYVKDRVEMAKSKASFWQDYKFVDPLTKKISPKSTYCEKLNDTAVCVGIYK